MSGPTDPAEAHFDKGSWGWDLTQWRKLPLVWGFSDVWDENFGGTADGVLYGRISSTPAAGQVFVLQGVSYTNCTEESDEVTLYLNRASGAWVVVAYAGPLARFIPLLFTGMLVLGPGDTLVLWATGVNVGNDIRAGLVGYKMAIAE